MGQIFSLDSKVMKVLNRIVDLVILNIVFLITCIPIITIEAATTALYSVTLKMAKNEEAYVVKEYFLYFKENFKKATVVWSLLLSVGIILYLDNLISGQFSGNFNMMMKIVFFVFQIVTMLIFSFIFPIMAKFENPIKVHFRNSICMPLASLDIMCVVLLINFLPVILMLCIPTVFLYGIYLFVMGWFAFAAYANSFFLNRMFHRYIEEGK